MTLRQMRKVVARWQERFGLGNWSIAVLRRPGRTLPGNRWGSVSYHRHLLTAAVQLPAERPPEGVEHTVCHELTHLALTELVDIFDAAKPGPKLKAVWDEAEERLCNHVARACVGHLGQPWPESAPQLIEGGPDQ